jgi:hypothetical protein
MATNSGIRLQMVMALGQGSGSMLATPEALDFVVSSQAVLIERAIGSWQTYQYAFVALVRLLGQIAATRAAMRGSPYIEQPDIEGALVIVLGICPCSEVVRTKT